MQQDLIRLIGIVISTKPRSTFQSPWNMCTSQYYHFRRFLWGLCFAFVIVSETVVAPHITLLGDHISLIRAFIFAAGFDAAKVRRVVLGCCACTESSNNNTATRARARDQCTLHFPWKYEFWGLLSEIILVPWEVGAGWSSGQINVARSLKMKFYLVEEAGSTSL